MTSHMSSIGFEMEEEKDFLRLVFESIQEGEKVQVHGGHYQYWALPSGGELWVQFMGDDDLCGINTHFGGEGRLLVRVMEKLVQEDETPLDGAFFGWVQDPDAPVEWEERPETESGEELDEEEMGLFPIIFDCPDAAAHAGRAWPALIPLQVALLAVELEFYLDEASFEKEKKPDFPIASQAFIPIGMFGEGPPSGIAMVTGHVEKVEKRNNEYSQNEFLWLLLRTIGGTIDVLVNPEVVEGEIPVGAIVVVEGWISGRYLD